MFTDMQDWTDIRRAVLVEGASKRSICRRYGIAHKTLQKILASSEPPGYRQRTPRPKTKLGPHLAVIEEILAADREAPAKQRHTAKRIFERLRDEHGYSGGPTQVRVTVARLRRHAGEVFVPLAHLPGRAQFDFGEAAVQIAGVRCKAHFAVMSLPYSDAFFMRAYPRECTETFQDAHVAAFAFFGGVPVKTDYDNSKIAVARIVGRERELTREFLRLEAHFLFRHRFCAVARGNEKGHVESLVGYGRRNFLVPVPSFASWGELNAYLRQRCRDDLARQLWGQTQTKAELLKDDRRAMLPLPGESFEARRVAQCAFRSSRTPVPPQAEHRFRSKPNTSERSDAFALLRLPYCSASGQLLVRSVVSSTHRLSFQLDPDGAVYEAVEQRVGDARVVDQVVPV